MVRSSLLLLYTTKKGLGFNSILWLVSKRDPLYLNVQWKGLDTTTGTEVSWYCGSSLSLILLNTSFVLNKFPLLNKGGSLNTMNQPTLKVPVQVPRFL